MPMCWCSRRPTTQTSSSLARQAWPPSITYWRLAAVEPASSVIKSARKLAANTCPGPRPASLMRLRARASAPAASPCSHPRALCLAHRSERRPRGYQVVAHRLGARVSGRHADAGGVDALFRHQVVLGVHGALRRESSTLARRALLLGLLIRGRFAHQHGIRVCMVLQRERDLVPAGLGYVVYTSRTRLVHIERDRAQRLGLRSRGHIRRRNHY